MGTRKTVVLHIGAMKTGTTYLQGKAYANRDALADAGVDLPGTKWSQQVWGVQELLGMGRSDPEIVRRNAGWWERISEEMRSSGGPVSLLTMEFLAFANRRQARRVVASFPDCEIRVVLTVRDTAAVVPALWQTTVTSGGTMTWQRFRAMFRLSSRGRGVSGAVLSRLRVPSAVRFAEAVDIRRMLRVWTAVLPPEQVHVVVVPGPDAPRDRLWELFCETVGVAPEIAADDGDNPNESLGYASAELVRRVNAAIELRHMRHQNVVKDDLGHNTLGRRRGKEERARLDGTTLAAALRWNAVCRRAIEGSGVVVHGDLADLPTAPRPGHVAQDEQSEPTDQELLEAAGAGLARMRRLVNRRTRRMMDPARAQAFADDLRVRVTGQEGWMSASDPVDAAIADLIVYAEGLIELRDLRQELRKRGRRRLS